MHPIDRLAGIVLSKGPARLRPFRGGWGDDAIRSRYKDETTNPQPRPPLPIQWHESADGVAHGIYDASDDLHPEGQTGHAIKVAATGPGTRVCVVMAAWNDHGYDTRLKIARDLAGRGVTSVLPENPYYGRRRPPGLDQPIHTVADFGLMGLEAIGEATGIASHLIDAGHDVGIAGYSMGGNMAAYVGAVMSRPVAIAALAASYSPGPVFLEGVLRSGISWDSLGGIVAEPRLREFLYAANVLTAPTPDHVRHAVIVGGTADGFIPRHATRDLHRHWPGSQLRWERGGHATLLWRHRDRLVEAIVASFDRTFPG